MVIVTHNSAPMIEGLLDSLPAALDGLDAEVVVVDNASTDQTRLIVSRRNDCQLVKAQNLGYSAGINRGLAASCSRGPILILNPDVRMDPQSIRFLVEALDGPQVGIAAPRVRSDSGRLQLSLRRDPTLLRALGLSRLTWPRVSEYVQEVDAYERPHDVDWALGAILAVSRSCADAVGRWDESFFLYSEETDYSLRARDLGFRVYFEPAATAVHVGAQSGQSDLIHSMQILNRVRLYRRRHRLVPSVLYYLATMLSEASWVVRGHSQSRVAISCLVRPHSRPSQLNCSDSLIPR